MALRRYSDPVHRIIALDRNLPFDALLMALIDTPEFQRLRRIRQLGLAFVVFQGAEHSRFAHSLGVMHTMTLALDTMRRSGLQIDAQVCGLARLAALLHDIGHGPFSHVMEKVLHQHHEDWTKRIIGDPATAIHGRPHQSRPTVAGHPELPCWRARFRPGLRRNWFPHNSTVTALITCCGTAS
ncbi:HD domain-containing protein [Chloracidobacterium sp. MS 40/45]|uniref:HD domain-containing protein n=1 Tax=Chloracidobacterium aggregatum TaxID=2851959 RepID=UPI001B8AFC90|nr:HD domain-containing protein [Chloracidobacterium aggregatum]QUW00818.1 HD domain-containing protein [Chloracidobacterium sp. MS 40/45]